LLKEEETLEFEVARLDKKEQQTSNWNSFCGVCGVSVKNFPSVRFRKHTKTKLIMCALCIEELQGMAAPLLSNVTDEKRTRYEQERFLHKL